LLAHFKFRSPPKLCLGKEYIIVILLGDDSHLSRAQIVLEPASVLLFQVQMKNNLHEGAAMFRKLLVLSILTLTIGQTASAKVRSNDPRDQRYVDVTTSGSLENPQFGFQICQAPGYCTQLGQRQFYSLHDLKNKRVVRWIRAGVTAAGEIVVVAGGGFFGYVGGAAMGSIYGAVLGSTTPAWIGAVGVGGTLGTASTLIKSVSPIEQGKIARTLRGDILNNKDVYVGNLNEFILRLDSILN
jgi:hypothetical protein